MTESASLTEREIAFVNDHPDRILRTKAAAHYLGITPKTLRVHERHGTAPPRVQLGPNSVGYRVRHLNAWLDARTKQRTAVEE